MKSFVLEVKLECKLKIGCYRSSPIAAVHTSGRICERVAFLMKVVSQIVVLNDKRFGLVSRQYLRFGQIEKVCDHDVIDLTLCMLLGWASYFSRYFAVHFLLTRDESEIESV